MARRLALAFSDLDALKRQTAELRALVVEVSNGDPSMYRDLQDRLKQAETLLQQSTGGMNGEQFQVSGNKEPTSEYEQLRRRLKNGVHEFWYYMSSELHKLQKQAQTSAPQMNSVGALLTDLSSLQKADQYDSWREKEAAELSDLVQRRLHFLQNPPDCSQARKLVCSLNKGCGFGCQLHHAVYCFMVAYGTERTLILKSFGWRYHKGGWEEVFLPLSNTCRDGDGATYAHWPGKPHTQVVDLPIIDSLSPRPPYLPLSVPADLAPRLSRLHGNPFVWWVGQFLKYMLRPQTSISTLLQESAHKLGFEKPIVGYPHYEILGDPVVAKSAAVATRYSDNSLMGIIVDIHFLSLSDYLVCTFSSQVCRVAYEIMQSLHPDAADRFHSLDDIYYYGGQLSHNQVAIYPHSAQSPGELDLKVGDQVGVAGNHWDGYSKGKNLRTDKIGLYPSFKVVDKVEVVDFPTYSEVPLKKPSNKDSKT
ncbi:Alpha-(1,6)-fucosyltransferase [Gryllus bimaculatus]|nr:Alpha-(1,6)-fucosyltransferase [Gryllus bimaculatus]